MHVFYLHGFASSPRSSKAAFFAGRLAAHGVALHCPDFNEPDFFTLTVTRMIDQEERAIAELTPGPAALIGSSLGGFVALHAAAKARGASERGAPAAGPERDEGARRANEWGWGPTSSGEMSPASAEKSRPPGPSSIEKLVLLAPALDFGTNRMRDLGEDGLARWRDTNRLDVLHYGYGEMRAVHYGLYEDARRYDSFAVRLDVPVLVFQGRRDESVDPDMVARFARSRPNVTLHLLEDGHQLLESLEFMWQETAKFLGLAHA